jgi:hypothetical protein
LRDGPHQISSAPLHKLVSQDGGFEIGHVVGGGDEAAIGNFVAGVEDAGVVDGAGFVLVIRAGAMPDDGEEVVGLRVVHGGGTKHVFVYEATYFWEAAPSRTQPRRV